MCILVVDDNDADRQVIVETLRREVGAVNIEACGQLASLRGAYDVAVLSQNTGTDVLAWMRAVRDRQKIVPIIVLAAEPQWDNAVALFKAGACDYLPKQALSRLAPAVREALARAATRQYSGEEIQELRASEERYRHTSRLASDFAYIYRIGYGGSFHIEWISDAFMKMTGYGSVEDLLAHGSWESLVHPEDMPVLLKSRKPLLAGETVEWDCRILAKDGTVHWIHNTEEQISGPCEVYRSRVAGVSHEITERKLAVEALHDKEARLRMALDAARMTTWEWLLEEDVVMTAPVFQEMLGDRPPMRETFLSMIHPDDREVMLELVDRTIREGIEYRQEYRFIDLEGKLHWYFATGCPFYDEQGKCTRLAGVNYEITEQKAVEAALRDQEARLRLALKAAAMTNWEWRLTDDAIISGDNHLNLMGAQPQTREAFQALIHPDDRQLIRETGDRAVAERTEFQGEFRIIEANGNIRWYSSHGRPIVNATGEVERLMGVTVEITARKRAEEELREGRDRLRILSRRLMDAQEIERRRLARELHDETGQALTAVKLNLQSLKRHNGDLQFSERLADTLNIVEELLNNLRNISHELRPSILDDLGLAAALRWYVDRQAQRAGLTANFQGPATDERLPSEIETACFRIVQEALTNIIRHAAAQTVQVELQRTPTECRLIVRDDGIGFNVRVARAHAAQGHSLGLLGMQERAQLAGGQFEIKSGKKGGTEIQVRFALPLAAVLTSNGRKTRAIANAH
jgi:PAS domain S-box-containing protein